MMKNKKQQSHHKDTNRKKIILALAIILAVFSFLFFYRSTGYAPQTQEPNKPMATTHIFIIKGENNAPSLMKIEKKFIDNAHDIQTRT